jgi:hypothetical protein
MTILHHFQAGTIAASVELKGGSGEGEILSSDRERVIGNNCIGLLSPTGLFVV